MENKSIFMCDFAHWALVFYALVICPSFLMDRVDIYALLPPCARLQVGQIHALTLLLVRNDSQMFISYKVSFKIFENFSKKYEAHEQISFFIRTEKRV